MKNHCHENERIKRRYLDYLKEANGQAPATLDQIAAALSRFESYTGHRDFRTFRPEQAKGLKAKLAEQINSRTGERLSKATLYSTGRALRAFFRWLASQQGYRSKLTYSDADFFNVSDNDARIATARRDRPAPTLEQISHVLASMPSDTDIELRNRALIAFTILTGTRDAALASLQLKHVDLIEGLVFQDARQVKTKRAKTFKTWFFPVGEEPLRIVTHWIGHLRQKLLWGNDDPLFPKTLVENGLGRTFQAVGVAREHWSTAQPIRDAFKQAFEQAGLPYFHPHSFRNTLALLGERRSSNAECFKAWSQNLGHESMTTTFFSYGTIAPGRQAELIREMGHGPEQSPALRELARMVRVEMARQSNPHPNQGPALA